MLPNRSTSIGAFHFVRAVNISRAISPAPRDVTIAPIMPAQKRKERRIPPAEKISGCEKRRGVFWCLYLRSLVCLQTGRLSDFLYLWGILNAESSLSTYPLVFVVCSAIPIRGQTPNLNLFVVSASVRLRQGPGS